MNESIATAGQNQPGPDSTAATTPQAEAPASSWPIVPSTPFGAAGQAAAASSAPAPAPVKVAPAKPVSKTVAVTVAVKKPAAKKAVARKAVVKKPDLRTAKVAVKFPPLTTKTTMPKTPAVKVSPAKKTVTAKTIVPVKTTARPVAKKAAAVNTPAKKAPAKKAVAVAPKVLVAKKAIAPVPGNTSDKAVQASTPKAKLVRDSFTMPQKDFALIAVLKDRALGFKRPTKKSELLRAGLQVLAALTAPALRAALESLTPLPTGRPKNTSK